jgi:hypothetical protein
VVCKQLLLILVSLAKTQEKNMTEAKRALLMGITGQDGSYLTKQLLEQWKN